MNTVAQEELFNVADIEYYSVYENCPLFLSLAKKDMRQRLLIEAVGIGLAAVDWMHITEQLSVIFMLAQPR